MTKFKHVARAVPSKPEPPKERVIEFVMEQINGYPTLRMYENGEPVDLPNVLWIDDGMLRFLGGVNPHCGLKLDAEGHIRLHPDTAKALGIKYDEAGK